jgi:two-component system cell cycle response regulator DivK
MMRHVSPRVPTVLLVESGQDDRGMYAEYLRLSDFHIVEIGDTADALALAATADVIVTGVRVPGPFDGIELVRRVRADRRTHDKGVIVLTACAFEPDQARAYSAGCDGFLPKPCLPDALATEIRRVMANRAMA